MSPDDDPRPDPEKKKPPPKIHPFFTARQAPPAQTQNPADHTRPAEAAKSKQEMTKPKQETAKSKPKVAKAATANPKAATATPKAAKAAPKTATAAPKMAKATPGADLVSLKMPQFGVKAAPAPILGSCDAPWPPRGMVHVRGGAEEEKGVLPGRAGWGWGGQGSGPRAAGEPPSGGSTGGDQGQEFRLTGEDDILRRLQQALQPKKESASDLSPLSPAYPNPSRRLETGRQLRSRLQPELGTYRTPSRDNLRKGGGNSGGDRHNTADDDDDELAPRPDQGPAKPTHPAVRHLYDLLAASLSAYDRSSCEAVAWAHKYGPASSGQVLQSSRDLAMLKSWLEGLKVEAVDTGAGGGGASNGRGAAGKAGPARKRRRKSRLDGFVVSSGGEDDELDELAELDEDDGTWAWAGGVSGGASAGSPRGGGGATAIAKRTAIRYGDVLARKSREPARLTNAVVISGPHGCGKTAAVFALARELEFEVFEINSASRRSGRDISERVGDMTRNHLVKGPQGPQQQQADRPAGSSFNPGQPAKPPTPAKPARLAAKKGGAGAAEKKATKAATGQKQKQSLILVEEVDVLFEEDRQFWSTLTSLMAQSKRPFIMTCTDESLVPLSTLRLHGIFRFAPPPRDLAADVLLLAAANEGHSLRRDAVEHLYESRGRDLRAALTELNFWCQIGVGPGEGAGEREAGPGWVYPRWPAGCDRDERDDVIRVVSDATYVDQMGWLAVARPGGGGQKEEVQGKHGGDDYHDHDDGIARQAWDEWGVDLQACHLANGVPAWVAAAGRTVEALDAYGRYCDAMSAADLCEAGAHGTGSQDIVDPTAPAMTAKAREDYPLGIQLIEASTVVPQSPLHLAISARLKSLALHTLPAGPLAPRLESLRPAPSRQLNRRDLGMAFDPLASGTTATTGMGPPSLSSGTTQQTAVDPSVFDRSMDLIVLDVAPWVRAIVASDQRLRQERMARSSLLSIGAGAGKEKKRMRNTRAAFSALEGGERRTTRRENYFEGTGVNTHLVARTGGQGWMEG